VGSADEWFPLNIVYAFAHKAESDQNQMLGITASYEPDIATFRENKKTCELTYFNREGGSCSVRVVLDRASGWLETFKYEGKKLIANAAKTSSFRRRCYNYFQ
jgi:hypothetical protein